MLINDKEWMRLQAIAKIIDPYVDHQVREVEGKKVISFGQSSAGYDIRLAYEFKMFTGNYIDPKADNPHETQYHTKPFMIEPGTMVLARSMEWITVPRTILLSCVGKSTWARTGLVVNVTPLEPEWEGYLTLELSNTSHLPIVLYPGEGIAQLLAFETQSPSVSYKDRGGKYMGQTEVVLPEV